MKIVAKLPFLAELLITWTAAKKLKKMMKKKRNLRIERLRDNSLFIYICLTHKFTHFYLHTYIY